MFFAISLGPASQGLSVLRGSHRGKEIKAQAFDKIVSELFDISCFFGHLKIELTSSERA